MKELRKIIEFVWPYFRRYRSRLVMGILLGMLFGASNAALVWATKTLMGRMAPAPAGVEAGRDPEAPAAAPAAIEVPSGFERFKSEADRRLTAWVDPWLPRVGRPVGWREVVGGLLLFPLVAAMRGRGWNH